MAGSVASGSTDFSLCHLTLEVEQGLELQAGWEMGYLKCRFAAAGLLLQPPTCVQAVCIELHRSADTIKVIQIETASGSSSWVWCVVAFYMQGKKVIDGLPCPSTGSDCI